MSWWLRCIGTKMLKHFHVYIVFTYGRLLLLVGPKGAGQSPAKDATC